MSVSSFLLPAQPVITLVQGLVLERLHGSHEQAVLLKYSETWARGMSAELAPLAGQSSIDPRFIRSLLLRKTPVVH